MSLFRRAVTTYREDGLGALVRGGVDLVREKGPGWFVRRAATRLLPVQQAKYALSFSDLLTATYFYFDGSFRHEQRAILRGHRLYDRRERRRADPEHRLIRHTHLLEKGLSMRDRRSRFGETQAITLVEDLIAAWGRRDDPAGDEQLYWTIDVLAAYFESVPVRGVLATASERFESFLADLEYEPDDRTPRRRADLEGESPAYADLRRLAERRSSTRWFREEPVPRADLDRAIAVAAESPSACNRQSFEFRVYDDPDLLDDILQPPLGVSGYRDNIPCLVVLVGKHRAYYRASEKNVVYIDASLAAMAFQFALETLDLASCTINWPAIPAEHERMQELLSLDPDEVVITLMAVGYPDPDGKVPYSSKKSLDKLRSFNRV